MKLPDQGFQKLEHRQDRQTHRQTDRQTQTDKQTDASECITSRIHGW